MQQIRLAEPKDQASIEAIANDAYVLYLERMDKKSLFPCLMIIKPILRQSIFMY